MRKLLLSILVAFLPLCMFGRNEAEQDTLVVNKADKVVVITSDSAQTIMIRGKEGNPDFKYSNSIQLVDSNYVSTSEMGKNWNISLWPIAKNSSKATSYPSTEIVGNFFVGFNGTPGMPSEADFRMFSSWELWWLTDVRVYPWNGRHCFSLGLGLDWRNYRIKGNTCFVKTENDEIKLSQYADGVTPKFSRIKVFSLNFPLRYHFYSKNIGFSLGPVLNLNMSSSIKTKWKENGKGVKMSTNNAEVKPVTVDFMATMNFFSYNLYFKYSPCDLIKDGHGMKFKTLSFGFFI